MYYLTLHMYMYMYLSVHMYIHVLFDFTHVLVCKITCIEKDVEMALVYNVHIQGGSDNTSLAGNHRYIPG